MFFREQRDSRKTEEGCVTRKENSILHNVPHTFVIMSVACSVSQFSAYMCTCEKLCDMHCRAAESFSTANGLMAWQFLIRSIMMVDSFWRPINLLFICQTQLKCVCYWFILIYFGNTDLLSSGSDVSHMVSSFPPTIGAVEPREQHEGAPWPVYWHFLAGGTTRNPHWPYSDQRGKDSRLRGHI